MPEPASATRHSEGIEPIDKLLVGGIVFFVLLMIGDSLWSPNDGQTFQVLTGLVTGFSAAFLARLKPSARGENTKTEENPKP